MTSPQDNISAQNATTSASLGEVSMLSIGNMLFYPIIEKILGIDRSRKSFYNRGPEYIGCDVYIPTSDGINIGAYLLKPIGGSVPNGKYVIAMHGVDDSREAFVRKSDLSILRNAGYHILVPDYRGFADSPDEFSVEGASLDIQACMNYLRRNFPAGNVYFFCHSLGTAIGMEYIKYAHKSGLSQEYLPEKIFLAAPFESIPKFLEEHSPALWNDISRLVPQIPQLLNFVIGYNTIENIRFMDPVKDRLFLYHGREDELISPENSKDISKRYNVPLLLLDSDHVGILMNKKMWINIISNMLDRKNPLLH